MSPTAATATAAAAVEKLDYSKLRIKQQPIPQNIPDTNYPNILFVIMNVNVHPLHYIHKSAIINTSYRHILPK